METINAIKQFLNNDITLVNFLLILIVLRIIYHILNKILQLAKRDIILPCPFCNSSASAYRNINDFDKIRRITCDNNLCAATMWCDSVDDWNKRA